MTIKTLSSIHSTNHWPNSTTTNHKRTTIHNNKYPLINGISIIIIMIQVSILEGIETIWPKSYHIRGTTNLRPHITWAKCLWVGKLNKEILTTIQIIIINKHIHKSSPLLLTYSESILTLRQGQKHNSPCSIWPLLIFPLRIIESAW